MTKMSISYENVLQKKSLLFKTWDSNLCSPFLNNSTILERNVHTYSFPSHVTLRFICVFTFPFIVCIALLTPHTAPLVGHPATWVHHPASRLRDRRSGTHIIRRFRVTHILSVCVSISFCQGVCVSIRFSWSSCISVSRGSCVRVCISMYALLYKQNNLK